MQNVGAAFGEAFGLLLGFDPALMEIIGLSPRVSLTAVLISGLMGLPPVVVGLLVYLSLSNAGPPNLEMLSATPSPCHKFFTCATPTIRL